MDDEKIKEIALTDDQLKALQRCDDNMRGCRTAIAQIIMEIEDITARRKRDVWHEMARMLGYKNEDDIHREGYQMVMSQVTRSVYLRRTTGEADAS